MVLRVTQKTIWQTRHGLGSGSVTRSHQENWMKSMGTSFGEECKCIHENCTHWVLNCNSQAKCIYNQRKRGVEVPEWLYALQVCKPVKQGPNHCCVIYTWWSRAASIATQMYLESVISKYFPQGCNCFPLEVELNAHCGNLSHCHVSWGHNLQLCFKELHVHCLYFQKNFILKINATEI